MGMAAGGILATVLPAIIGGAAKVGSSIISGKNKNKQEEKMATIDRTKSGVVDFGEDMMGQFNPNSQNRLSLIKRKSLGL